MSSEDGEASPTERPPGARRRRPAATIEGTATEIASEPAAQPAPGPEPQATAAPDPDPTPAAGEPPREPPPAGEAPHEPASANPRFAGDPRPLIAGGAAGLAAAIVILVALWALGAFAPDGAGSAALAGRVAALEAQVRSLAARPAPADAKAMDDLRARVDVIDASLRRLDDRLARAESALATPRSAPTDPAVLARLAAAESMQRTLDASIGDLRKRIDDVAAAAKAAAPATAAAGERGELDALTARVEALERDAKTLRQSLSAEFGKREASADRAVRLALVAATLRAAVERGAPFAPELAAAKALAADAAALAPLEAFAAAGVPTAETLARDLIKLEPAMSEAAAPASQDGGIIARLQANAARLIHIRRSGEPPGDDPAAGLARAIAKAQRGDIAGALAEVERLPPAVKAPAADWIKAAQARTAAVDAARRLAADALAALGKASP
jgi:hypothetical protein